MDVLEYFSEKMFNVKRFFIISSHFTENIVIDAICDRETTNVVGADLFEIFTKI